MEKMQCFEMGLIECIQHAWWRRSLILQKGDDDGCYFDFCIPDFHINEISRAQDQFGIDTQHKVSMTFLP